MVVFGVFGVLASLSSAAELTGKSATFAKDVAPILQDAQLSIQAAISIVDLLQIALRGLELSLRGSFHLGELVDQTFPVEPRCQA